MNVIYKSLKSPIYLQVAEKIRDEIFCGVYRPGTRLPSIRRISKEIGVNPNTIQRAIKVLRWENLIEKHSTQGNFVISDLSLLSKVRQDIVKFTLNEFIHAMHQIEYSNDMVCDLIDNWRSG